MRELKGLGFEVVSRDASGRGESPYDCPHRCGLTPEMLANQLARFHCGLAHLLVLPEAGDHILHFIGWDGSASGHGVML